MPRAMFPADAYTFFAELEVNNERGWWLANKDRFDTSVGGPMRALLDELDADLGPFRTFRMNRDVRFSKDKSPYKTAHAAMTETEGGSVLYLRIDRTGLYVGGGLHHMLRDQLARFREAIDDERIGTALVDAVTTTRAAGLEVFGGAEQLASAPRGYAKDHPRIELLRWKGCTTGRDLGTKATVARVREVWAEAAPVLQWLDANVGPSELPPPD